MAMRILICFPAGDAPGLRADAAQLALGLAAGGHEVIALGPLGAWRHPLRLARVTASEYALPGDERKITRAIQEYEPQVIHAFGAEAAHLTLPLTLLVGAGGVATLGHDDLPHLNPSQFRTASTVFTPCEYLREQVARRLPTLPVVTAGYLLPPAEMTPRAQSRFLAEELGVRDDAPLIVLADHFHGSETEVALTLIKATPLLIERMPGVQIVVAGQGMRLGELEAAAIEINDRLGYRAVLLPGHRDDITHLLSLAHIAVGSGRFAMEAVGAGVATICAGAAGMIGTFTAESTQVAYFTCCGRHGRLEPVTPRALASEIIGLSSYAEYRERFAIEGQNAVLAQASRTTRAAQLATYYTRTSPSGTVNNTPQRIAVVLPDDLRELLFTLPALSGLREHYPLAHVQVIAPQEHLALLEQMALAERVLPRPADWRGWLVLLRAMRHPRTTTCLVYPHDLQSALLAALPLTPQRVGFAEGWGSLLLSDSLPARPPISPARALTLTNVLGVSSGGPLTPPTLPVDMRETVGLSLLAAGVEYTDPLILLCPRADAGYAWPRAHWEALLQRLAGDRPERVAVLDPSADLRLPEGVVPVMPVNNSLMLATLLSRAEVVIAPDNGALHLATLLGVPAIGLYGPTSPKVCCLPGEALYPLCHREFPCHPCAEAVCPERHCLRALTPGEVAGAVVKILSPGLGVG